MDTQTQPKTALRGQNTKKFTLTQAIKARKALSFAARYNPLPFGQRMKLAKAQKTINATFGLN